MNVYFSATLRFVMAGTDDAFEALLGAVIDELESLGVEADYTAALSAREVTFDWEVAGTDLATAEGAMSALRTALHAADCATPQWPRGTGHTVTGTKVCALQAV